MPTTHDERRRLEGLSRAELESHQLQRLNTLLEEILPHNRFYAERLRGVKLPIRSLADFARLPYTFKQDLAGTPASRDLARNHTWPAERYVRFHRTSGTHGRPLVVLDTAEDWQAWIDIWQFVLDAAGIEAGDRVLFAFSFGPFVGFWSAFDAVAARGAMVVPGGGMNSLARLALLRDSGATAFFSTPSYAMHLAEVGKGQGIDAASLGVRKIIVAGEPGGSLPAVRGRIESAWKARVIDHAGASEVGPWGYADAARRGLHVNAADFIAEFLSVASGEPAREGELAELVLTTLRRPGCPVVRYRTGDLVRPAWGMEGTCRFVLLEGGVLGRADDMLIVRGVNIFPSAVDEIVRGFPEVAEYRLAAERRGELDFLVMEIEDSLDRPARVAEQLELRLGLKVEVRTVAGGSLPRFEAKGRRVVDRRAEG
jgi:phenylacetate-CoA ligase